MELTPIAADKIKDIIAQNENPENLMLRIDFEGYG
jgi:Fe-S cluster assembly iron-binding protein IscA